MEPPFGPVLISVGNVSVYWYGFLIATGILLGARVATYLAREEGEDPEAIWDMMVAVVILAIIGARAYHVFSSPAGGLLGWSYYKANPMQAFAIWNGGLGIYGAIIGGALGVALFCARRGLNVFTWLDIMVPGMALGQSIGRWGNYMNRELYGPPTTLPWGLRIPGPDRIPPYTDLSVYPDSIRFHPTFLYESLACLALCLILLWAARRWAGRRLPGDLLCGYMMGYGVIRFFTEMLRPDAWMAGNLAAAQVVGIALIVVGAATVAVRHLAFERSNV